MASRNNDSDVQTAPNLDGTEAKQYRATLHRYLTRRLHNAEDAQDLAQEAYLRFLQLPNAGLVRRPSGYLFRIAVNLVYEFRLRRDRAPVTYDSSIVEERAATLSDLDNSDPGDRLSSTEQLERVLYHIPRAYRLVLLMHKRDGLSYDEIATKLGLSKHSVRKYLARAIAYGRLATWD